MASKVHVNDTGTDFILNVGTDISDATLVEIDIMKPDGTTATWDAVVYETSKIKHAIVSNDFNITGRYKAQSQVTTPDGKWSGDEIEFIVYRKLIENL